MICVIKFLLAAISISYAPQNTNEYVFKQVPNNQRISYNSKWKYYNDKLNSGMFAEDWMPVGVLRRCPIIGQPFSSKRLRHEDLAWIQEAIEERKQVPLDSMSSQTANWGDSFYFYKKNKLLNPDFSFTNRYCVANPSSSEGAYVVNYDDWFITSDKGEKIRNYFGGNSNKIYISYSPSSNVKENHTLKKSDFEPIVQDIQGFSTGCVSMYGWSNYGSNDTITVRKEFVGTKIVGEWNDYDFTYQVKDRTPTETTYRSRNDSFLASYSYDDTRLRYFYPTQWDTKNAIFKSIAETTETGHYSEYKEHTSQGGLAFVVFYASTNSMMAGGYNRLNGCKAYLAFRLTEEVEDDDSKIVDIDKIVVLPDDGSGSIMWGYSAKQAVKSVYTISDDDIIYVFGKTPAEYYSDAFSACNLEWQKSIRADTPDNVSYSDLTSWEKTHKSHREEVKNKWRVQTISYYGTYLFHNVKFRMK